MRRILILAHPKYFLGKICKDEISWENSSLFWQLSKTFSLGRVATLNVYVNKYRDKPLTFDIRALLFYWFYSSLLYFFIYLEHLSRCCDCGKTRQGSEKNEVRMRKYSRKLSSPMINTSIQETPNVRKRPVCINSV